MQNYAVPKSIEYKMKENCNFIKMFDQIYATKAYLVLVIGKISGSDLILIFSKVLFKMEEKFKK